MPDGGRGNAEKRRSGRLESGAQGRAVCEGIGAAGGRRISADPLRCLFNSEKRADPSSQTPRPFWRALARCIGIGSRCSAAPSLVQKVFQFEPMAVQLHCVIEKGFIVEEKGIFPHTQYE
ncbi:hypothetical protein DPX16_20708 [Anabarilius grahami]|uniref:Uncharacterized protein n=1 Tax=Anabarilius grahami TaxID=495550 RepID=A0A3N0YQ69_ANAGA|nr:hypothetical protein DPX16_20708 [Anabarilius grahami]